MLLSYISQSQKDYSEYYLLGSLDLESKISQKGRTILGRAAITVYIPSQGSVIRVERNTSISPLFLLLLLLFLLLLTLLQSKLLLVVPHLRLLSILVETSKWLLVLGRLHPISPHMSSLATIFANLGGHLSCITCPWEDLATRIPGGSWKVCC